MHLSAKLRLFLLTLAAILLPAACSGSPLPVSTITVPDCTLAAIPGLTQAPAPPNPLDASGSVVAPGATAGMLPGSGSVSPTGEYRYRIPIDVPPGRAGMAPSLALTYSSRGKNGHLGVGWQLEGLSEIDRCPRTFAVDGFSDGVRLDDHDAFCLDGHELVPLGPWNPSTPNGCAGTEYRTEDDTFARIVSCGTGNNIGMFTVFSKDGRIRTYNAVQISSDGSPLPGDNPAGGTVDFAWLLSVDQDRAGNSIHYSYGQEIAPFSWNAGAAVEWYPTEIDYTFQETTGETGQRSIVFGYVPRPDPSFSVVAGVQVNVTSLLSTIEAWAPNPTAPEMVWQYDLTYDTSPTSGASLLAEVQRCGALGGCLPAKTFGWKSTTGAQFEAIPLKHTSLVSMSVPIVLDADGDGRDDIVYYGEGTNGAAFVLNTVDPSKPLQHEAEVLDGIPGLDVGNARAIDLDGDGRDELVVPDKLPGFYDVLSLATSLCCEYASFAARQLPGGSGIDTGTQEPAFFADLDGDGLPDLITGAPTSAGPNAWNWSFLLNKAGLTFAPAVSVGSFTISPLMAGNLPVSFAADQGQHRATLYFGQAETGAQAGRVLGLALDSQGTPSLVQPPSGPFVDLQPQQAQLNASADFNGDGIQEQVAVVVSPSSISILVGGAGWNGVESPPIPWQGDAIDASLVSVQVADLDGDGRDDLVISYRSTPPHAWLVHFAASGQFETKTLPAPPDAIGDFDGDGLLDFATYDTNAQAWTLHRQSGGGTADRLVQVLDAGSAEARETVSYSNTFSAAPAPAPEPPAPSGCAYPRSCMRHGFSVVREHDVYQGDAVAGPAYRQTFYDYDGARFDVRGRGFLGFGTVRQWEPQRGAETVTTYDDVTLVDSERAYPNAGQPKHVRRAVLLPGSGGAARIAEIDFTYQLELLNHKTTWYVHPATWTSVEWEQPVTVPGGTVAEHITGIQAANTATALRVRNATYSYDEYGNVLDARVQTANGVTTETVTSYMPPTSDWLVGLVQSRRVASTSAQQSATSGPRRTDYTYNTLGYLCQAYVDQDDQDPSMVEVFTYAYDADGQSRAVTASAVGQPARTTHVAYDTSERVFRTETWNDLGQATWSAHDPALGVLAAIEDANGTRTTFQYDDLGRMLARTPDGGATVHVRYAPWLGATMIDVLGTSVFVTRAGGAETRTDTDALGRAVGGGHLGFDGTWIEAARHYDVLGRVVAVQRPGFGAPRSAATLYAYDGLDRLTHVTSPDQKVTTIDSTFFTTTTIDPLGDVRGVERDPDDRVATSFGVGTGGEVRTAYAYGDFSQLETTTDARGNMVRVQYDRRGRRTRVDDPDAGYRTFSYDGFGDLVGSSVGGKVTTIYTIDVLGRVTEADASTGDVTTWMWDTSPYGIGRLAQTTSPDGTAQGFSYDDAGRLANETWTVDGAPYAFDLRYEPAGRLGEIDYPEVAGQPRFSVVYGYNDFGAVSDVVDGTSMTPYWTAVGRNEDDRLLQATLGNGLVQTRAYDDTTGRLTTAVDGAPGVTAMSLAYDYDDVGRVRNRTNTAASRTEAFGYDDLGRLDEWSLGSWIDLPGSLSAPVPIHTTDYGYDELGNLTTVTVDGALTESNVYGVGAGPHALTSNTQGVYDYDDRGRQTRAPGRSVTYTELDLPRTVTMAEGVTSFAYDAGDVRVKKEGPAGTVVTLGGLFEQREAYAAVEAVFYVNGPEGVVAQVVLDESAGTSTTEFLHHDALGSVGAVSDATGAVTGQMFYEPFGARRDANGDAVASIGGDVPLGFTGQRHDDELRLIDMRGRVYDPTLRRFLTPDPYVTDPLWGQSYNRYSYVVNDPVNLVDPSGFDPGDPDPNEPDYPAGCYGVIGCGSSYSGVVVDLPGQESGGGGSSAPAFPSGGPVITAITRPYSIPVGPTAPATSIAGPVGQAWLHPQSPDFMRQVSFDITQRIAYNNALWEAAAPVRELVAHWYTSGLSTPAKDQAWWGQVGGKGLPPIGFGYYAPRAWAGAGEQQGAEVVNAGLGAAGLAKSALGMVAGLQATEAAGEAAEAAGAAAGGGRLFSHFTNAEGASGITGIAADQLGIGQQVVLDELRFGQGVNDYLAGEPGRIFVTELGPEASEGALNQIGVFGVKQQFVIQFSEEAAFSQGIRVLGEVPSRSIFSIPGGSTLQGQFTLQRLW